MARVSPLPLRARLTVVSTLAAAGVLVALGAVLYLRLDGALDEALERGLRARADDVVALTGAGGLEAGQLASGGEGYVQILTADGSVVDGSPALGASPVLGPGELDAVRRQDLVVERAGLVEADESIRFLARALPGAGASVVVVGASTEPSADALESLLVQLAIVGPLSLLLVAGVAYAVAGAALRPVERMRTEAEAVSASAPIGRLTVPRADDELSRLATTLNAMLTRLEEALERERRFVADAGHELRTPLANLEAELELALRHERTQAELVAAIRSAAEESERLSRLAGDLLTLARTAEGQLQVRPEALDVDDLLARVRARHMPRVQEAGRALERPAPTGIVLQADGILLEQALGNLVENALRHGTGGIRLGAVRRDGLVELHVTDEGPGIDASLGAAAFEPFTKASEARSTPGAGLGLAIVAAIAAAHGGSAHTTATGQEGADVWLTLPADTPTPEAAGAQTL